MKGYQLKITIKGSSPPIWRRVVVPEKISFEDLDNVIEYIFGNDSKRRISYGRRIGRSGSICTTFRRPGEVALLFAHG